MESSCARACTAAGRVLISGSAMHYIDVYTGRVSGVGIIQQLKCGLYPQRGAEVTNRVIPSVRWGYHSGREQRRRKKRRIHVTVLMLRSHFSTTR